MTHEERAANLVQHHPEGIVFRTYKEEEGVIRRGFVICKCNNISRADVEAIRAAITEQIRAAASVARAGGAE
jgi:hypothetical protein